MTLPPTVAAPFSFEIEELPSLTGWSHNRVYDLIAEGLLDTYVHGKRRFVSARALDKCIRELERRTREGAKPTTTPPIPRRRRKSSQNALRAQREGRS